MTPDPFPFESDSSEQIADPLNRQSSSWDIRNAPRNYLSLIAFQLGSALFSFASVWLITRYLGSEGYGGLVAVIAASQAAQILVNWTGSAVVRFGIDEFIQTEQIARTFWTRLIILTVNLILVVGLSPFWFPPLAALLNLGPASFGLVLTHLAVTAVWLHLQMSLQGVKLLRTQGFLMMIERILIFGGVIGLAATANLTPVAALLCYIAAPATIILVGIYQLRRYIFVRFSVNGTFVRKIIVYSLPLLPFALVGYLSGSYFDAFFILHFLSKSDLGVYSIATQLNGIALQLPVLANTLLLPLFVTLRSETAHDRMSNYFQNILPSLTLIWCLACTAFAFVAYFMIPVVFGQEFQAAAAPLWILLTASGLAAPVLFGYTAYSHAVSATYISTAAGAASAATNILLNLLLIPRYGVIGCAWATLFSFVASELVVVILTRRLEPFPLSWILYSVVPILLAVCTFSLTGNSFAAMGICIAATLGIAFAFSKSLIESAATIRQLRGR